MEEDDIYGDLPNYDLESEMQKVTFKIKSPRTT